MNKFLPKQKGVLALLLALFAGMGTVYAYDFSATCSTGQTLYYNITNSTSHFVEITYPGTSTSNPWEGYTQPTGNITLPSTVTYNGSTYTVKRIGDYAFYTCSGLTGSLFIPNSVTNIDEYAFDGCSGFTGSLTIGNSVTTIGNYAFRNCNSFMGSLTLSNSVIAIGTAAFYGCSSFTGSLTIGNSVTDMGPAAFYGCSGFTGSLTIGNSVTTISNSAFYGCSGFTGSLTIGNSVTTIGPVAFSGCSGFTGSLTIGNSVTDMGPSAFFGCSGFTQVNYNAVYCADVASSDQPFEGCGGTLTIGSNVRRIPAYMFCGCVNFTGSLTIGNSVTSIGTAAFSGCSGFTGTLTLGNSLATIGTAAFYSCSGFTGSLTIGNSVTEICNSAFYGCSGFTGSLTIGNSVTTIGPVAFCGCSGFTGSLTIGNSVTDMGPFAFSGCSGFTQVNYNAVNCADVESSDKPFKGCGGTLTIGSNVRRIPAYMFFECVNFTGSLTIGNSVASIGTAAFFGCNGFTGSLTIGNSVTTIDPAAFSGCSGFTGSLTLGNSVTTISNSAFNGCSGFTGSLSIGNSVTTIGPVAFSGCSGFTGLLTIGNSVTDIGPAAFSGCVNLTAMRVYPEIPPTTENSFVDISTDIPVYVPCVSLEDYQAAPGWSAFTNMQCLLETLTVYDGTATNNRIPAYIFYFDDFARSQFLIPAADLADMTGTPISSMTFYTTGSGVPYTTVSSADVYLKEVNYTAISAYEPKSSATTVYSGYFDIVSVGNGGKMTINFSTPYTYNGGNLLIGIENTEDNGWQGISFYGQTVSGASISGSNVSSTGTISATQQNFIPKTTFCYTPSDCSRPIALTTTGITTNSAMLNWTGFQDEYDIHYRTKPLFFEDFENGLPSGWTTIDNDGDSYNWISSTSYSSSYCHNGTGLMYSESWIYSVGALSPDNWLITPQLALQGTMKVWLRASDPGYLDHFAIYLSTTGNEVSDFATVLVPETTVTGEYVCYTADLSVYAGQQGYIAIRHFNCTDMYRLLLDDFGIFNDPDETGEWETLYNIGPSYTLGTLEPATEYEWQVRGRDCDGSGTFTGWSAACSFTTKCEALVVDAGNPFTEDFEGAAFAPACWENISSGIYHWSSSTSQSHSSSHSAFSEWYGDIYLVLPDIELSAHTSSAQLSFWSYNSYPSDFAEGYNTVVLLNGGTETVLWSAETVSQEWVETIVDLTDYLGQTVSLAFKYAGYNGNGWYVDDVEVSVMASISLAGGDWHLIASPLVSVNPDDIPGMTTGDYDLYRYEPSATDEEWRNFKNTPFSLQSGQGYLYAHGTDVTLVFDGTSYTVTEPVEVSLIYDANDSHKCWNLVGNPYKCKAYLNREYYVLNAEGTGINPEPLPIGTPIPPYTAVFVKAIATGDTVVFTKIVP